MKKLIAFAGFAAYMLAACDVTVDNAGESAEADMPAVGTSPYTNCNFDSVPSEDAYDTVILNGRVMDPECDFDGMRNVGIKDGRIALITEGEISGADSIDASGHVVAPGFINTHNHAFAHFDQKLLAYDGITTALDTEGGGADVALFYDRYENDAVINFGIGVGHEPIRRVVMDDVDVAISSDPSEMLLSRGAAQEDGHGSWALDIPTDEQYEQIYTMFEQGMRDGAVAVSSTVGYMGYGVPPDEIFTLQKIAKKYDRFYGSHTRFGPTESLPRHYSLGTREAIANAVALDGALILSHIQNQGWPEIYELSRRLQAQGMIVFAEYYPHIFGSPNIATPQLLPDKIKENNVYPPSEYIVDIRTGEFFPDDETFFGSQEESPEMMVFIKVRPEVWWNQWAHMTEIAVASDAINYLDAEGKPLPIDAPLSEYGGHPRNIATSSWLLRQAREQNIPLMGVINNLAYVPAKYYTMLGGLKALDERGRLQQGMIADITIFDPATVRETAEMKAGKFGSAPAGMPYVMVNGQLVIDNGAANTDIRPGQPIRYPVITEGEIVLDYNDKQFQWHADLSDEEVEALTEPQN